MKNSDRYYKERGVKPSYRKLLGLRDIPGGFTVPWFDADGKVLFRQTRHMPPIEIDGREVKATFPKDTEIDFNHLPLTDGREWRRDIYGDTSTPVFITESVSKGAALAQLGYAVLTTGSVYGHRSKKTKNGLIRGLDAIPLAGRKVRILFDNDVYENTDVQDALFDLGQELTARGAIVETVLLPRPEWDEHDRRFVKMGVDDFVAQQGANAEAALEELPVHELTDPALATWGKHKSPPKPSVVDTLNFAARPIEVLTKPPPERQHVVAPWIGKGQLAFLAMAGGAGKGFLSLSLAVHIATGRKWFGMSVKQGRVVLLCLEDSAEELDRRLHFIVQHYAKRYRLDHATTRKAMHLQVLDNVRYESIEGQQLHIIQEQNRNIIQTAELGQLALKLKTLEPILIVVDPLSQLHSLNENDNSVGSAIVSAVGHIRTVTGAAVLVPAHVSKAADDKGTKSANAMRGASSFATGARSVIHGDVLDAKYAATQFMIEEHEAKDRFAIFTHVKNNYGPKAEPIYMVRGEHGVWEPYDELRIPKRDQNHDRSAWLNQLQRWLTTKKRDYFSRNEVTQTLLNEIFTNCGRPVAEKHFDTAVEAGEICKLSKDERSQLPSAARKGSGDRFRMATKGTK